MALAQVSTALVLIAPTRRTLLVMLHTLPLLGAVISGIVSFAAKLSSEHTSMQNVEFGTCGAGAMVRKHSLVYNGCYILRDADPVFAYA